MKGKKYFYLLFFTKDGRWKSLHIDQFFKFVMNTRKALKGSAWLINLDSWFLRSRGISQNMADSVFSRTNHSFCFILYIYEGETWSECKVIQVNKVVDFFGQLIFTWEQNIFHIYIYELIIFLFSPNYELVLSQQLIGSGQDI